MFCRLKYRPYADGSRLDAVGGCPAPALQAQIGLVVKPLEAALGVSGAWVPLGRERPMQVLCMRRSRACDSVILSSWNRQSLWLCRALHALKWRMTTIVAVHDCACYAWGAGVTQIDRVVEAVEETLKGNTVQMLAKKALPRLDLPKVRPAMSVAKHCEAMSGIARKGAANMHRPILAHHDM